MFEPSLVAFAVVKGELLIERPLCQDVPVPNQREGQLDPAPKSMELDANGEF